MSDPNQPDIERVGKGLQSAFEGTMSWEWDSRFETVLAKFSVDESDGVRAVLERDLSAVWDSSNIGEAPANVRTISNRLNGLASGQLLFTSDPDQDAVVFCAWWPWGDGKTISIRVAPAYKGLSGSNAPEQTKLFRGWFGV